MWNKSTLQRTLEQHYRQFIQFLNDLHLPPTLSYILIYFPMLTIMGDLLIHMDSIQFLTNLAGLNLSTLVIELALKLPWFHILIKAILLKLLILPLFCALLIVAWTVLKIRKDEVQIGYFWHTYQKSFICRAVRCYVRTFQRLTFPITISIGIKLITSKSIVHDSATGTLILILSLMSSLIFHYYDLQIPNKTAGGQYHKYINFPNIIIENILILVTIITINTTTGLVPYICCLGLLILRAITNHIFKFETGPYYLQTQFSIFSCIAITAALCISQSTNHFSIMGFCICVTFAILLYNKPTYSPHDSYEEVEQDFTKEVTIDHIKNMFSNDKIAKAFREAVLMQRKKNSHRNQLILNIIKNKCFEQQRLNRCASKIADCLELLTYESIIVKIIKNILKIQDKCIQVFNLLKNKEPKQQILIKEVSELVDYIDQNKEQFLKCMKIDFFAIQLNSLAELFFRKLYNDGTFIRESKNQLQQQNCLIKCKSVHKQLFEKDKALIVVDVLDEIGKITRASNNLPNIIGYTPHSLVGLPINQLMSYTIRECHDKVLINFIHNFSSETPRYKKAVQSYAYDKSFHLQKIQIKCKFFMNFFDNFELAGVLQSVQTQQYLIITDQYGNIEGWTPKIGQIFNFDQIAGNDCIAYNLIPMLPAFAKNNLKQQLCCRTIFFKPNKVKSPKLMILDKKKRVQDPQQIKKKQIAAHTELLKNGQFHEGYLVSVQVRILDIKQTGRHIISFELTQLKRIQNFQKIQSIILANLDGIDTKDLGKSSQFDPASGISREKSLQQSEQAEFSIVKSNQIQQGPPDFNFTLETDKSNFFDIGQLKLSKDLQKTHAIFSSRNIIRIQVQQQKQEGQVISDNLNFQSIFEPKLSRKSNFVWAVALFTCVLIGLIIWDAIHTSQVYASLVSNKEQILRGNKAQAIYCKTVFNPNETYVNQFHNGNLLIYSDWLTQNTLMYKTYDGNSIQQNIFYLFNVQVPSTLDRVVRLSNGTDGYMSELSSNFYSVINEYQNMYTKYKQVWNAEIINAKNRCKYQVIAFSFGILIYELFLVFIYRRYQDQRKVTQAFFKFQKIDLDHKIQNVKFLANVISKRCDQWFIDPYLHEIKKVSKTTISKRQSPSTQQHTQTHNQIKKENSPQPNSNMQELSHKKIQIQQLDNIQVGIAKKRFYFFLGFGAVLLVSQLIFIILQTVLKTNMFNTYIEEIKVIDDASKLTVYPNLMMANIFHPAPPQIVKEYEQTVQRIFSKPSPYMPDLNQLLTKSPCQNCTFLSQILKTNYRSFYSYFMQTISNYNSSSDLATLYYAVDVVVDKISKSLHSVSTTSHNLISLIYFFSFAIFFVAIFIILRHMQAQYLKLQCFLKFFTVESLLKNKHMSTVMAKNM